MKGGTFSQWLKEFCALVFTQTIQSFLLAVVLMIVIISISNGTDANNYNNITPAGIFAVIALTSISKMEDLLKKMFGLNSSITDTSMSGGKGGLLGTYMALQLFKKAANNIPKMASGVKGIGSGINQRRKAKLDYANSVKKATDRYNNLHPAGSSGNTAPGESSNGQLNAPSGTVMAGTGGAGGSGAGAGGSGRDVTITNSNVNMPGSSNTVNGGKPGSLKDQYDLEDKIAKLKEDYDKKRKEANDNIKKSGLNIASGAAETVGAIGGGAMGAVVAAGMGDNILEGVGKGIGVGDMIGKYAVQGAATAAKAAVSPAVLGKQIGNDILNGLDLKDVSKDIANLRATNKEIDKALKKFNINDIY